MNKDTILLFDTSTLLHNVRTSKTRSKCYLSAMLQMERNLKHSLGVVRVVWVLDKNGSRFRKDLFAEYKGHRKDVKQTEVEKAELKRMHEFQDNLHIFKDQLQVEVVEGVEADDVICALANDDMVQNRYNVEVSTVDKDFLSALSYSRIYNWRKARYCTSEDTLGLTRNKYLMYQALQGDATDNIKGVCGKATALVLAKNFKTFPSMRGFDAANIEQLQGITPYNKRYVAATITKLKTDECWADLKLSYNLVEIFRDIKNLNDVEEGAYFDIVDNILMWKKSDEMSEDLEDFMIEQGMAHLIEDLKYV